MATFVFCRMQILSYFLISCFRQLTCSGSRPKRAVKVFEKWDCAPPPQSALEFCPIHCPNGRLGQDLGFGGFAFALKLPELLNRSLAAVRAQLGQTSCFPNWPRICCPIGQ